jgi:hypothetical protein
VLATNGGRLFDFCSKSESSTTELCHSLLDVKRNHLAFASPCLKKSGGVSLPPSGRVIAVCATAEVANITRERAGPYITRCKRRSP